MITNKLAAEGKQDGRARVAKVSRKKIFVGSLRRCVTSAASELRGCFGFESHSMICVHTRCLRFTKPGKVNQTRLHVYGRERSPPLERSDSSARLQTREGRDRSSKRSQTFAYVRKHGNLLGRESRCLSVDNKFFTIPSPSSPPPRALSRAQTRDRSSRRGKNHVRTYLRNGFDSAGIDSARLVFVHSVNSGLV